MIKLKVLSGETRSPQLPGDEIYPVQSAPAWVEPEDGNTELITTIDCLGKNAPPNKDQTSTSVSNGERRRTLHELQSNVASPVFDPPEIAGPIEIADLSRSTRCHDNVWGAEVNHPLAAQFDCFVVRSAPRLRSRRLPFHNTSLPETAVPGTCAPSLEERMSALARSLTLTTSSRRNAPIGDWS